MFTPAKLNLSTILSAFIGQKKRYIYIIVLIGFHWLLWPRMHPLFKTSVYLKGENLISCDLGKGQSDCLRIKLMYIFVQGAIGLLKCNSTVHDIDLKVKVKVNIINRFPRFVFLLLSNTIAYLAPIMCYWICLKLRMTLT